MYRIMIVKAKRDDYASLYQYLTTTTEDGVVQPLELADKAALDEKVESMLNDEGYAKSDFIVVRVIDYVVDATAYSDEADDTTPDADDTGDTTPDPDNDNTEG